MATPPRPQSLAWRLRWWVSSRLVDVACWIEPPQPVELREVIRDLASARIVPAPKPKAPAPIIEPVDDGTTKAAADCLRHLAWLVENRHVNGFAIDWLDRNQPKSKVNYPPGVGRA